MRSGVLALAGAAAWCAPGLAPHVALTVRPRSASRARCRRGTPRGRPDLRRRPARPGHAGRAGAAGRARRAGDLLPRRRAGGAPPRAGGRDRRGRPRHRPARLPPPQPDARRPAGARRRPRARPRADRRGHGARAHRLPAALRDLHARPAWRSPAGEGWEPMLWSRWGKDWRRFVTPEKHRPAGDRPASSAATSCCSTTPTTTARRGSWRRTVGRPADRASTGSSGAACAASSLWRRPGGWRRCRPGRSRRARRAAG